MQSYKNVVQRKTGDVVSGATVKVYDVGTTTLSTIYSDNGSTAIDQSTSPLSSSSEGEYEFWAADGVYDVKYTYGSETESFEIILFDPIRGGGTGNHVIGGPVTPDTLLHIWKASAGTVAASANTLLTIENNTGSNVQFLGPNTAFQAIYFGDADDNDIGRITYDHATDVLSLVAGAGNCLRVDANATAGNTRLLIYDVDNATLERVSVGAADSGGAGFKVLRIPN